MLIEYTYKPTSLSSQEVVEMFSRQGKIEDKPCAEFLNFVTEGFQVLDDCAVAISDIALELLVVESIKEGEEIHKRFSAVQENRRCQEKEIIFRLSKLLGQQQVDDQFSELRRVWNQRKLRIVW